MRLRFQSVKPHTHNSISPLIASPSPSLNKRCHRQMKMHWHRELYGSYNNYISDTCHLVFLLWFYSNGIELNTHHRVITKQVWEVCGLSCQSGLTLIKKYAKIIVIFWLIFLMTLLLWLLLFLKSFPESFGECHWKSHPTFLAPALHHIPAPKIRDPNTAVTLLLNSVLIASLQTHHPHIEVLP